MKFIRPTTIIDSSGSFTRASTGTYYDSAGQLQTAAINVPRITHDPSAPISTLAVDGYTHLGLLIESAAQNILWPSAVPVTRAYTLSAGTYTLSFRGPGKVVVTGTASGTLDNTVSNSASWQWTDYEVVAGNFVIGKQYKISSVGNTNFTTIGAANNSIGTIFTATGTGAGTTGKALLRKDMLVSLTFTATAGSVTLTFTGSPVHGQLELGTKATSLIVTTGAAASRSADIVAGNSGSLVYSSLPETDYPEWNAATNYTATVGAVIGSRVIRTTASTHKVYECLVSGVDATTPEVSETAALPRWIAISPTNKWAAFDERVGTSSEFTSASGADASITYLLKPGRINSLALLEVDASYVKISLVLPSTGEIIYAAGYDLISGNEVGDWYQYFYEPISTQNSLVINTNLLDAALLNIPSAGEAILAITILRPAVAATVQSVSIGVIVVGLIVTLGSTQTSPTVGIVDYSRKDIDQFGNAIIVQRRYSKRITVKIMLPSTTVDDTARILAQYRATPVVWVGANSLYASLVVYGFYKDWEVTIDNILYSSCTLTVEGMT